MIESKIAGYPILLPEHRHAFHSERPDWHKAWLDSIYESLKPDDVVIDVGAEQGDLSALVASWVPDGGVILVEPQPLFWPTIRETFEANELEPLFNCVAYAGEESDGEAVIRNGWPPEAYGKRAFDPGFYHMNEIPAPTLALSDPLEPGQPGLPVAQAMIIDVEGAELHALRGTQAFLYWWRPTVWCAIHPEIMRDRYGHDPNELLAYMYRLGYRWDFLGFQGELHFKFSPR